MVQDVPKAVQRSVLGSFWAVLRPSWGRAEVVHARPGAVLGPSWALWIQKVSTAPPLFRRVILAGVGKGKGFSYYQQPINHQSYNAINLLALILHAVQGRWNF